MATLLDGATPTNWWVDGGLKNAYLHETLTFTNGYSVTLSAKGQFMMETPSIVGFDPSLLQVYESTNIGTGALNNPSAAISWIIHVQPPTNFTGTATYTQLIDRFASYDVDYHGIVVQEGAGDSTDGAYWLDNNTPYALDTPVHFDGGYTNKPVFHNDTPGLDAAYPFNSYVEVIDHFETYLQFQPDGNGSIPVTIGEIDWGWGIDAEKTNGVWTWTNSINYYGPNTNWDNGSFPAWTQTYKNN